MGTNVESLIQMLGNQRNQREEIHRDEHQSQEVKQPTKFTSPDFAVAPVPTKEKSHATAVAARPHSPHSEERSNESGPSYGAEYPDIPEDSKLLVKTKLTPETSPGSTDTEINPTAVPPEMEILADLISRKGLQFLTMTHTKASLNMPCMKTQQM